MRRRLFNLLATLSLPLFVAAVALWVRNHSHGHGVALPLWRRACVTLQAFPGSIIPLTRMSR